MSAKYLILISETMSNIIRRCGSILLILSAMYGTSRFVLSHYFYRKKREKPKEIHEVIMFSTSSVVLEKSKYSKCLITHSMSRLLHYLNSPTKTLDICMYVLTNTDIANVILKIHYRGVKVRLIIDADMAFASGSHCRRFDKLGIPVRWMKSTNLMHHKFCLIDAAVQAEEQAVPVLVMGSLNWTNQALTGNWEDVAVTSQEQLVQSYQTEFERMWEAFKPVIKLSR